MRMSMDEFTQELLKRSALEGTVLESSIVTKNNSVRLHAVRPVQREKGIAPMVYLEPFYERYQEGENWNSVLDELNALFTQKPDEAYKNIPFQDFEKMKEKIFYKLINYEMNKELLEEIPHRRVLDLAIVYAVLVSDPMDQTESAATILIRNTHMQVWNSDEHEIWGIAERNTPEMFPAKVTTMAQVMNDLMGDTEGELFDEDLMQDNPMYVVTNSRMFLGAGVMFYQGIMEQLEKKLNQSLIILPSSVNELIVIPDNGHMQSQELMEMVKEVNHTQVDAEEVLSNQVYRYNDGRYQIAV